MNKLTKIGVSALAGSLAMTAVHAAEGSVSVSTGFAFASAGDENTKTTAYQFDSVVFSASGETEGGITVSASMELDNDNPATNAGMDNRSVSFGSDSMGTVTFHGHGGDSVMGQWDDVTPNAYEEAWDVVAGADAGIINGHSGENMFTYSYDHDSGFKFVAAYLNASDAQSDVSYSDFGVEYTGVDGLKLVYAAGDVESVTGTKTEENTIAGTYAMGAITVGVQVSESDSNQANADTESSGVGVSYQVNDDLSVSYGAHTIEYATGSDQESTSIGISYTMGSMSISGAMNQVDNIANSAANDRDAYEFGVSFSF